MRRIVALALSVAMVLALAACGGGTPTMGGDVTAGSESGPATDNERDTSPETEGVVRDGEVAIRTNYMEAELSKELIAKFEAENPGIRIVQEAVDETKMASLLATNDAPDVLRVTGVLDIPSYVTRRIAMNIDDLITQSELIDVDDLFDIAHVYRYDGTSTGKGPWYGLPKDFSSDYALYYNKACFERANVELPVETTVMTWNEVIELAEKLTIKDGDTFVQYGLGNWQNFVMPDFYMLNQYVLSVGESLSAPDKKSMDFTKPVVVDFVNLWTDAAKADIGPNPINNEQMGGGDLFLMDQYALFVAGYWFSGVIRGHETASKNTSNFGMLPTPKAEGGKRVAPTGSATGGIIYAQTKHKEEAWKFFEWFFAGEPSDDRAKSGWGLPAFKSKLSLMPQNDDFDKQVLRVTEDEMGYTDTFIDINPYFGNAGSPTFAKWIDPYIVWRATLEETLEGITKDANQTISEMVSVLGG